MSLYGAVEAGGSKFVCAAGSGPGDLSRITIPTTTPAETLDKVMAFFRGQMRQKALDAVGVASFGPVDLDPASPTFGFITSTPKTGWANTDICGPLRRSLNVPVAFDTDVNAAALAEAKWGAAQGLDSALYLTIGSGIGGGAVVRGMPLGGRGHPEMGHIPIPHDREADPFPGICPFHGDCLEGLASGPAMERRWGARAEHLPVEHPAWTLEAHYLALALANFTLVLSPRAIILGGGVMHRVEVFPLIRAKLREVLGGYVQMPKVIPPALGDDAGVLGAIVLAERLVSSTA